MNISIRKKVVLVIPNTRWYERRPWMISNNCAFVITAILKDEYDFSILDANGADLTKEEVGKRLQDLKPDAVLVSGVSIEYRKQYHAVFSIARKIDPDVKTILGGSYCTLLPEDAIKTDPNLSYVFVGHAEERLAPFMRRVFSNDPELENMEGIAFRNEAGRIQVNSLVKKVVQLKQLKDLDYTYMDLSPYLDQEHMDFMANGKGKTFMLMTSRGCPHNCVFCANKVLQGRGLAFYSAQKVLSDMKYLIEKYDVNHFIFIDDLFLYDRKRVDEIIQGIVDLRETYPSLTWHHANVSAWHLDTELLTSMKKSGCDKIIISIESGSKRVLKEIIRKPLKLDIIPGVVKMCRKAGMDIGANFVIGLPGETWDEIRHTFAFAEELDLDLAHFHIATPQPGTDLHKISMEQGYLPSDFSFLDERFFGYCEGFISTDEFTPEELKVLRAYEWDRINFSTPEKIEKAAQMYMTTADKLNEHRKHTRRKLGVHVNMDDRGINRL